MTDEIPECRSDTEIYDGTMSLESSPRELRSRLTFLCQAGQSVINPEESEEQRRTILRAATSGVIHCFVALVTCSRTLSLTAVTNNCCSPGSALTANAAKNRQTGSSSKSISGRIVLSDEAACPER